MSLKSPRILHKLACMNFGMSVPVILAFIFGTWVPGRVFCVLWFLKIGPLGSYLGSNLGNLHKEVLCCIRVFYASILARFPQALEIMENLENHEKKFHAWKNHGIWKILNNHGKIMEFCEIIWWNLCVWQLVFWLLVVSSFNYFKMHA